MSTIKMSEELNHNRRRFLRNVTVAFVAAELATIGSADAQSSQTSPPQVPQIRPGTNTSFGSLKQTNAGLLNVGYAEAGPADGPAVVLSARMALRHSQLCTVLLCGHEISKRQTYVSYRVSSRFSV
jgi:hypothetical protein